MLQVCLAVEDDIYPRHKITKRRYDYADQIELQPQIAHVDGVIHQRMVHGGHAKTYRRSQKEECEGYKITCCRIGIFDAKILQQVPFTSQEYQPRDQMRVDIDCFVMQIFPAIKTRTGRVRNWPIAMKNEFVVRVPFRDFMERDQCLETLVCAGLDWQTFRYRAFAR